MATFTSRPLVSLRPSFKTMSAVSVSRSRMFLLPPQSRGLRIYYPVKLALKPLLQSKYSRGVQRRGVFCEAQETSLDAVPIVTDATWEAEVLKADCPVVVDFWAPWCGPCGLIDPIINETAKEYAGKLKFFKLNTDQSPGVASQYGVRSIPTIMIFVKGEKRETIIGAVPKNSLTSSIEKFL